MNNIRRAYYQIVGLWLKVKPRHCLTCGHIGRRAVERDMGLPACRKCGCHY